MQIFWKIVLSMIVTTALIFAGLIILIWVAFSGGREFEQILIAVGDASLILFAFAFIWGWLRLKTRLISFAVIAGVIGFCFAGIGIYKAYQNSIPRVNEQGVDLTQYAPFSKNTKAVSLNEPCTLTIEEHLPLLDGATALYPLYSAFAKAVYPEETYKSSITTMSDPVVCNNTVGAYNRLIDGYSDIVFAAAPSKDQLQAAKEKGAELKLTPIGREAFVFFVNAKNRVNNLSTEDIQRIYSGEAMNWKEFGGKDTGIRAFQRPKNSGSQTMLQKIMGDTPLMTPPKVDVISGMGGIISEVSSYKNYDNAIGYSFLFFATEMVKDNKIKLLSINGISPVRENVANQTYPYSAQFYAVTAGTKNANAQKLIDWILSEQGQYLVEKTGYTPIK